MPISAALRNAAESTDLIKKTKVVYLPCQLDTWRSLKVFSLQNLKLRILNFLN